MLHLPHSKPRAGFCQQQDPAFDWSSLFQFDPFPGSRTRTPLLEIGQVDTSRQHHSTPHNRKPFRWSWPDRKPQSPSDTFEVQAEGYSQEMSNGHGLQHPSAALPLEKLPHASEGRPRNSMAFVYNSKQAQALKENSRPASRAPSPIQFEKPPGQDHASTTRYAGHPAVASYLHLPPEIAAGRPGSLAMFAAQITCLFWFESKTVLASVENSDKCPTPVTRLIPEAKPATGFLKWVTTILTTTQVATNVVLLALMFIYRLKKQNPYVQGKPGSEFRLLTVALMLGNKFLDDNTYTNKTWADVSGIPVYEIHVMEVEFLSHMKYNLYTSKEQWLDWYAQLNKFWTYCEMASRKPADDLLDSSPFRAPAMHAFPLPSPPASTSASPPYASVITPNASGLASYSNLPGQLAPLSISPAGSVSEYDHGTVLRKRSWDDASQEPWPKRQHTSTSQRAASTQPAYGLSQQGPLPSLPLLPFPVLPTPTSQGSYNSHATYMPQTSGTFQSYTPDSMTPSSSHLPSANWLNAIPQPSFPSQRRGYQPSGHYASYDETPLSSAVSTIGYSIAQPSQMSTPAVDYSQYSEAHSGQKLSPSHYLSKRTSPYRPVRDLNQLVQAPPSTHMSQYPAQISHDQIQWQPLEKKVNDREVRNGRVPQFDGQGFNPNWWPAAYQSDSTYLPYDTYAPAR